MLDWYQLYETNQAFDMFYCQWRIIEKIVNIFIWKVRLMI